MENFFLQRNALCINKLRILSPAQQATNTTVPLRIEFIFLSLRISSCHYLNLESWVDS